MTDPDKRLLELVRGRAGEAFRAALRYDADEWTMLYVREDVATDELRDAVPTIVDRARAYDPVVDPDTYRSLGETQTTVELYEEAAVLHFRLGEDAGVLVSLDRGVAQGLGQFAAECIDVLSDE